VGGPSGWGYDGSHLWFSPLIRSLDFFYLRFWIRNADML
jgi:hypothetical protein